jgi:DNA-binding response OmpR family regulator
VFIPEAHGEGSRFSRGGVEMVVIQDAELDFLDVLFIADDLDLAEMYRLKLELDGYWVRTVGLDSAVAAARAQRPDMLFLDLPPGHPERLEILGDVREAVRRPDLPAILLAGSTYPDLVREGAVLGAADYVVRVASAR